MRHWGRGSVVFHSTFLSGVPGSDYTVLHFLCPCKFWSKSREERGGCFVQEHAKLESMRHWGRGSVVLHSTVLSGVPGSDYTVLHFLCPCKFWSKSREESGGGLLCRAC